MRKSFKVMPGVRMTVTPRGMSTSVGGKAGRVAVNCLRQGDDDRPWL